MDNENPNTKVEEISSTLGILVEWSFSDFDRVISTRPPSRFTQFEVEDEPFVRQAFSIKLCQLWPDFNDGLNHIQNQTTNLNIKHEEFQSTEGTNGHKAHFLYKILTPI